jgi:hypothetical protein
MGWDVFCCICGNGCYNNNFESLKTWFEDVVSNIVPDTDIKNILKRTKWINKSLTLLWNNKIQKNTNKNFNCEDSLPYVDKLDHGIFIHLDCWKFIKINYGIELKYCNLPVNYKNIDKNDLRIPPLMKMKYGEIQKYWRQDFDYLNNYLDKNTYMIDSPLISSNTKNITRIKKIISQLKLKKELRPSPPISATFYKNNDIKIGSNNKFWIIKNNKWIQLNEPIIKKSFTIDITNWYKPAKIPKIGEYNNKPIFIFKHLYIKKKYYVEFIGFEKTINELKFK